MNKRTDELLHELEESKDVSRYLQDNHEEFLDMTLPELLQQLLEQQGLKTAQAVTLSCKGDYIYQVFRGIKNPSRDVLLCMALALSLSPEEADHLLRVARVLRLDPRNRRDSVLLFALRRKLTVPEANDLLYELHEPCL